MLRSWFQPLCAVSLPCPSNGRQVYMQEIDAASPSLPDFLSDYLEPVKQLLEKAGVFKGTAYLTVDEKNVPAGGTQRRPHPHVDGCFYPNLKRWGGGGGGWNHYCNGVPLERMSVVIAASKGGAKAWQGDFDETPKEDGDLSHVTLPDANVLEGNVGYLLSPDCIHESPVYEEETPRTFMRLALPVSNN